MQQFLLLRIGSHRGTDAVHHAPDGRTAHSQVAGDLIGAGRFLRVEHQREHEKPVAQADMRAVEQRADRHREGAATIPALPARHIPVAAGMAARADATAVGAMRLAGPAHLFQMLNRLLLGLKGLEDFEDIHRAPRSDAHNLLESRHSVKSKSVPFRNFIVRENEIRAAIAALDIGCRRSRHEGSFHRALF